MNDPNAISAASARCALHPDRAAEVNCARCGNFMCAECSAGGTQSQCPTCRARSGDQAFPFSRSSTEGLFNYCWEVFKREWLMLSLGILITFGVGYVIQLGSALIFGAGANLFAAPQGVFRAGLQASIIGISTFILQTAVQGFLLMGFAQLCRHVLLGHKADLGILFSQARKTSGYILITCVFILLALVAVIPFAVMTISFGRHAMVWVGLLIPLFVLLAAVFFIPWVFAPTELAFSERNAPLAALGKAMRVGSGGRLRMWLALLVAVFIVLAGVLLCCVGVIPAAALAQLYITGMYMALRSGVDDSGADARGTHG